jgi:hypothetical protein
MANRKGIGQYFEMSFLTSDLILKNVLFALFLGFLAMIYIANAHYSERNVRQIQELRRELKEIRWHYMTLQAENMYKSRRSAIAKNVKEIGLEPAKDKPKKIILKD